MLARFKKRNARACNKRAAVGSLHRVFLRQGAVPRDDILLRCLFGFIPKGENCILYDTFLVGFAICEAKLSAVFR